MIGWLFRGRWAGGILVGVLAAAAGLGVFATPPAMASSTVRITTAVDETTPGDGGCSLREAIAYADRTAGGDQDCGVSPSGTTTIVVPAESSPFPLSSQLEITGTAPGPVVIRGAGVGRTTIDAEGHDRVLKVDVGADVRLDGLTLTGGRARAGGGVFNLGSLSLENVAVTGNATTSALPGTGLDGGPGGGIVNASAGVQGSGVLFLLDSTVSGNATGSGASGSGGTSAICATATQNTLGEPGGSGGPGGGIAERSGVVNIQDSTISSNTTGAGGQGGQGGAGDPGCFPAGAAGGSAGNGGAGAGVFNRGGTLIVGGSTFAANVTGRGGQGGAGGSSLPPVCTGGPGSSGGAGGSGAGIATGDPTGVVGGVTLTVLNSTIAFNRAGGGGDGGPGGCGLVGGSTNAPGPTGSLGIRGSGAGIFQFTGSATVTNATIAEPLQGIPTATLAISSIAVASGSFIEANTIIQGARCLGPISDGGFNLNFQAFFCPGRTANPGLEGLANNGGPTQTMALAGFSAAIDQGPAFPLICPATDQRGEPRPDNSETACDIGAFEVQDSPSLPSSVISGAGAGPRSVALGVHTPGTHGATITVALSKPRALVLLVRRIAGRRLITLGYARLGKHPGGRSRFNWNLRVGGRLLPPGRYQLVLYALDGNVLSLPSKPGARTLIVDAHRRARIG